MSETILEVKDLQTFFYVNNKELRAVDGLSYSVKKGECVAIVGESASGKSVSALSVLRLVPYPPGLIVGGEIFFEGTNLLKLSDDEVKKIRGNRISIIFQEPGTALNPVLSIGKQLTEALRLHQGLRKKDADKRAIELMEMVGIPNPEQRIREYPYQLSGGMQQRVMIAMALSCNPSLIIADEPTTALDVTVQAQVLEVLNALRSKFGTAVILITHNLGVVARYADRVNVMYAGRIVESGSADDIFEQASHPYTKGLLAAVPRLDAPADKELVGIEGNPPNLAELSPNECAFADRCKYVQEICRMERPKSVEIGAGHYSACCRWSELKEMWEVDS